MGISSPENCLETATDEVRAAQALRDDLLAVLFPHGDALPSELLQTQVKLKLRALVNGIEVQLDGPESRGKSWECLSRSGLLREKSLIDFALARLSEDQLQKAAQGSGAISPLAQLPVTLLGNENARIADMAKALLHSEQMALDENQLFQRLPAEQMHLLCWRIVAALQEAASDSNTERQSRAEALLVTHNGEKDPAIVARKLVFFLGSEWQHTLVDPLKAGLRLFVANLAQIYDLPADMLLRLITADSVAPLLLLLRGASVSLEQLPSALVSLRGAQASDPVNLVEIYGSIDPVDARAQIAGWAAEIGEAV